MVKQLYTRYCAISPLEVKRYQIPFEQDAIISVKAKFFRRASLAHGAQLVPFYSDISLNAIGKTKTPMKS